MAAGPIPVVGCSILAWDSVVEAQYPVDPNLAVAMAAGPILVVEHSILEQDSVAVHLAAGMWTDPSPAVERLILAMDLADLRHHYLVIVAEMVVAPIPVAEHSILA